MPRILLYFEALLLCLPGSIAPSQQRHFDTEPFYYCANQPVLDPSFEGTPGSSPWATSSTAGGTLLVNDPSRAQTASGFLNLGGIVIDQQVDVQRVDQTITFPEIENTDFDLIGVFEIVLRLSIHVPSRDGDPGDALTLKIDDQVVDYISMQDAEAFKDGYVERSYVINRFADGQPHAISMEFITIGTGSGVNEIRIDDLSVCQRITAYSHCIENRVLDPSLELTEQFQVWETESTTGSVVCVRSCLPDENYAHSGAGAFHFGYKGSDSLEVGSAMQTVEVTDVMEDLSFYLWISEADDPDAFLEVSLDGDLLQRFTTADATEYGTGYAKVSIDISSYGEGDYDLLFYSESAGQTSFYVDDIFMCPSQLGPPQVLDFSIPFGISIDAVDSNVDQSLIEYNYQWTNEDGSINVHHGPTSDAADGLIPSRDRVNTIGSNSWTVTAYPQIGLDTAGPPVSGTFNFYPFRGFGLAGWPDHPGKRSPAGTSSRQVPDDCIINAVGNADFEQGDTVWTTGSDVLEPMINAEGSGYTANSGEFYANFGRLAGSGFTDTQFISQTVFIPEGPSSTYLGFHLYAPELTGSESDYLSILVDGSEVRRYTVNDLAFFESNYGQSQIDITEYADGFTHEIRFEAHIQGTDEGLNVFLLDDVFVCVDYFFSQCRGNIVPDPSLEIGIESTPWDTFSTNFQTPICAGFCFTGTPEPGNTGERFLWFGGVDDSVQEIGYARQQITFPTYPAELSFFARIFRDGNETDYLDVIVDGEQLYTITPADMETFGNGYTEVILDLSKYCDGQPHTLEFYSEVNGPGSASFFVDDINICRRIPEAPVITDYSPILGISIDAIFPGVLNDHVVFTYTWTSDGDDPEVVHGPTTERADGLFESRDNVTFDVGETFRVKVTSTDDVTGLGSDFQFGFRIVSDSYFEGFVIK